MKRHPALRQFSDDHHQGLVSALRLRRAASGEVGDPVMAARSFLEFWREETEPHFRKEEEVLLPVLARQGINLDREPVARMFAQHSSIRGLAARLGGELERKDAREETLRELGELLEAHIRLEERVVFPVLEEDLPEDALEEIARRLSDFEAEISAKL